MSHDHADPQLIADVEKQVRAWLDTSAAQPVDPSATQLADMLEAPGGLEFTVGFVDRVIRPEDTRVAGRALRELTANAPSFLPLHLKAALRAGSVMSRPAPWMVVPAARRALRAMVSHLLIDASPDKLGKALARLHRRGVSLNLNLLGEAVLGQDEADRRLRGTRALLERDDVDYVSIKVSSPVAPHSPWAYDEAVADAADRLLPLYQYAAAQSARGNRKFINLDMEEYHDLDITIDVFQQLLDRDDLLELEAGIVLQAYLPDALGAMVRLQDWAAARRARGGAPIKVRLVKGANLPMEVVASSLHGWPLATWGSKEQSDTNYKRVLDFALTPERLDAVRVGVAGHNLFDIAYAWVLAGRRGARDGIEFEMLLGMAEGQAEAVRETVGGLLLYVPVVHPEDFDSAISYLVRRLEEGASQANFMSAVFDLHDDRVLFQREKDRFLASLAHLDREIPAPHRTQDRRHRVDRAAMEAFANTPDTDPSLPGNRAWGREVIDRIAESTLGRDTVEAHRVASVEQVEALVSEAYAAGAAWGACSAAERGVILRDAAIAFERQRGELLEVAGHECGKTLDQSDPEVSEAIDFLNYYAGLGEGLERVDGASPVPVPLTLVVPPWNFPLAIPTGGVAAALAAGSAVVIKPAPQAERCAAVLCETLWQAGVPREVLRLAYVPEDETGRALIAHPAVGRLVLTGAYETAETFRRFRPDLQLLAETSGKNSLIVTPSADLDLAVKDLVASAFGHAGQKCSAASLAILVGSVADSDRFRTQLVDAVRSLKVAHPNDPTAQMGPIIEPADGKLLQALTSLNEGEEWLVEPRRLDETGRLWSPGVKTGVRPGSEYHLTEYFGPVLGLMRADSLDEAIALQNQVAYGLTAGLHSLDRDELVTWIGRVEAGNAYANRTTVGAIVRRQPFGGWKKSAVGAGTKAGGPNYLMGLTDWTTRPAREAAAPVAAATALLGAARRAGLPTEALARAIGSDATAMREEFGVARDISALVAEKNVFRYLPVPVTVRLESTDDTAMAELVRVVAAGLAAGASVTVSAATPLSEALGRAIVDTGAQVMVEDASAWARTLRGDRAPGRVRLIGGSREQFAEASEGRPDVALYAQPVTEAGRLEMLPFLHEQAVAITAHRFGNPAPWAEGLA